MALDVDPITPSQYTMTLNVDKLALSEYRLTQNPSWQDILANEIARDIFEDESFSPKEVTTVKEFMRNLREDKRQHLKRTIRNYELAEFKKQFLLNLAQLNRLAQEDGLSPEVRIPIGTITTPTTLMRKNFEDKKECELRFHDPVRLRVERALRETVHFFYDESYEPGEVFGMSGWVGRGWVRLPAVLLGPDDRDVLMDSGDGFEAQELCEELAAACPTFACEGLNAP